ncbi:hypothetical protein [Agreia sp. VKM Ac-1783]|uniref:hypothetical protein n=1 Tax=Agreia sp. VKM Ac-1783 TaxID=1938889 RepID=UPI000A2ADDF7|nr:hypothetical protein [Agreia sp. VKM Ac-1783]SMQ71887.1 hypothetical protein SAMN06295943_2774 [Agreia sp. VKM Ac-1783]
MIAALLLAIIFVTVFIVGATSVLLAAARQRREERAKLSAFANAAIVKRRLDAQAFEAAQAIQEAIRKNGGSRG